MKKSIICILFSLFVSDGYAQKYPAPQIIRESFYSKILEDSIEYLVYLPYNWNQDEKHPCVYLNSYGALSGGNGMLFAADINNFVNDFPSTVVVEILSGQMDKMDYDYKTGNVGQTGMKFIGFLQQELFPSIERNYNTTKFRAFIGQSYSSSYANYLFLHHPGLFNAYVLLTPEKLGENNPSFIITDSLRNYYDSHYTFYYVAAAGNDYQRRIDYANEIKEKVKVLDTNYFFFEHHLFPEEGHMSTVLAAHLPALKFIFKNASFSIPDSVENIVSWFDSTIRMQNRLYGIDIVKSSKLQNRIIYNIKNKKDLDFFASYFDDSVSCPLMNDYYARLNNTALRYFEFKDWEKAILYTNKLIKVAKDHKDILWIYTGYYLLGEVIYSNGLKNKELAWNAFKESLDLTNYPNCKFLLGQTAANNNFNLEDGIKYLNEYITDKQQNKPEANYSISDADLLIAKCFYFKADKANAGKYLKKSLQQNPNNTDAIKWKKEMKL